MSPKKKKVDKLCAGCSNYGSAKLNEYGFYNCSVCAVTVEEKGGKKLIYIRTIGEEKKLVKVIG